MEWTQLKVILGNKFGKDRMHLNPERVTAFISGIFEATSITNKDFDGRAVIAEGFRDMKFERPETSDYPDEFHFGVEISSQIQMGKF